MKTAEWTELLTKRFAGTEYQASHAEYYGWCAGVNADDDHEDVFEAWMEQQDNADVEV